MNLSRAVSKLIGAFAIYRIIKQQIDSNNYDTIDLSTFDHIVKQLLERNPDLKMFVAKLSSNVDTARLHERKIANFLYKQAEKTKGSPLNEAEKKHIRENVLPKSFSEKIAMKNAYETELGRPMSRDEQTNLMKFVFPSTEGTSVVITPPPVLTGETDSTPVGSPRIPPRGEEEIAIKKTSNAKQRSIRAEVERMKFAMS